MTDAVLSDFVGQPWDRQRADDGELEPMLWFSRFDKYYRPQGPERSLLEAYNLWRGERGRGKASGAPQSWLDNQKEWCWQERAEAWDLEQRRRRIAEEEEQRREMRKRHLRYARAMQAVASYELDQMRKLIEARKPIDLPEGEVRRWLVEAIGIERQARGIPDHLLAVATMDDDQLLQHIQALLTAPSDLGTSGVADRGEAEEPRPPWELGDEG